MNVNTYSALRTLTLLGAAAFALTGCMTQEDGNPADNASDGQSAFLVSEVDQMGQGLGQMSPGLAQTAAPALGLTGEQVIAPFSYQEDCGCFVRKANFTGQRGYERERLDSVILLDSEGATMDTWLPADASKIIYHRDVNNINGACEARVHIDMTVDLTTEGDVRVGVWNGTMSGTFRGQELKSGSVMNVVCPLTEGSFGFPTSGLIELTRPAFQYQVEFPGEGKAKATIRSRRNKRAHVLWVNADYTETEPAAAE